jgi:CubicO group peptidase (beta-lactamase class C family)
VIVQPEHLFRVASISKLITAVAILKMEEYGLLSIDDLVFGNSGILNDSIYLKYRDRNVEKITVRHLLEHSAGWSNRNGDPMFMHGRISNIMDTPLPIDTETIIQYILTHHRVQYVPGTRSIYSNIGYAVLGKVIEKISGMPYEDYVSQKILYPMGIYNMKIGKNFNEQRDISETAYYDKEGAEPRLAYDGSGRLVPRQYGGSDITTLGAAGGWIASAVDLMKLMTYIDGYNHVIDFIDPVSLEKLTCPRLPHLSPLGWRETNAEGTWWRTGTLAGTSTLMVRQNDGICYVVLLNTSTWRGSRFTKDINRMMDKALASVDEWPDADLFRLQVPENLKPISPALANRIR